MAGKNRSKRSHSHKFSRAPFVCPTCGRTTRGRRHLCHCDETIDLSRCQFTGEEASLGPGDRPAPEEMRFVCAQCGRKTPFRDGVCRPEEI